MITEEVKKEIEELVREGEKLIDALRREGNNSKDATYFLNSISPPPNICIMAWSLTMTRQ